MKVILTGASGFIGGAVLQRLITLSNVTSIIVLSRRELPIENPKLKTIVVKDFLNYEQQVLDQLAGAEACIWVLGSATSGKDVHQDMTFAATKAFSESILPTLQKGMQFRFVYTSGALVVRLGKIETRIVNLESEYAPSWKSCVVRPALVTDGEPMMRLLLSGHYIPKQELAATMADLAVNGGSQQTLDNIDLRQRSRAVIEEET
ncbi:Putative 3-beta hydroxysteroid dehydrogenase/isomerase, NAD(P)-binding domain superfamily [Septoria linicola]|uniref:3-beta hydroxysteroid dehydrogenase/isomerase, NAD(P)-binding domain superfamily n=1 Tax=Septoria linicola TaxID=215465 RepID=A0A9Q9AM74_9PEZI|nr:Putative 3-beta hydroxysteroid dehydrogenase/isomerase, NAD(P)-binding domain superfamily [Septoria linicola]